MKLRPNLHYRTCELLSGLGRRLGFDRSFAIERETQIAANRKRPVEQI